MRTFSPKAGDIQRQWHVIDASDVVLGRLASQVAILLRGKHKPVFAPHIDTGDFVVVVYAEKVALSGNKLQDKRAYRHSGYPRIRWAGTCSANSRSTRAPITRIRPSSRPRSRSSRSRSRRGRPLAAGDAATMTRADEEVRGKYRGRVH